MTAPAVLGQRALQTSDIDLAKPGHQGPSVRLTDDVLDRLGHQLVQVASQIAVMVVR